MTGAQLKSRLGRGEAVYGTMLTSPISTRNTWMLRQVGLDFAVIDTEHTTLAAADVENMAAAVGMVGCVPFVRIPSRDPLAVTRALDAGTQGVVIPYCETAEEVRACVETARCYPMRSTRSGAAVHRNLVTVVGIESVAAVSSLDSLLSVEGIDAVFVGTRDLSYSVGAPNDLEHRQVKQAFSRILRACTSRGIAVAIWPLPVKLARYWASRGMTLVLHSSDQQAMYDGLERDFRSLRGRS